MTTLTSGVAHGHPQTAARPGDAGRGSCAATAARGADLEGGQALHVGAQLTVGVGQVGDALAQVGDLAVAFGERRAQLVALRGETDRRVARRPAGQPLLRRLRRCVLLTTAGAGAARRSAPRGRRWRRSPRRAPCRARPAAGRARSRTSRSNAAPSRSTLVCSARRSADSASSVAVVFARPCHIQPMSIAHPSQLPLVVMARPGHAMWAIERPEPVRPRGPDRGHLGTAPHRARPRPGRAHRAAGRPRRGAPPSSAARSTCAERVGMFSTPRYTSTSPAAVRAQVSAAPLARTSARPARSPARRRRAAPRSRAASSAVLQSRGDDRHATR